MKSGTVLKVGGACVMCVVCGSGVMAQCADWVDQPTMRRAGAVRAVVSWDPDGSGPATPWLVVAGEFRRADGEPVSNIAAWDGTVWHDLGGGITNTHGGGVRALAVYEGQLIAGGGFAVAGTEPVFNIARWDGVSWRPIGEGVFGTDSGQTVVESMTEYNGELVIGGHFGTVNGVSCRNIARWNGTFWRPLDAGVTGLVPPSADVAALAVYHNELYAGGAFTSAGGAACVNVAKWNGSVWSAVSGGVGDGTLTTRVNALTTHSGELIVGGRFTGIGGVTACRNIAAWNGSSWRGLGSSECGVNDTVSALASVGGLLYAGGFLTEADGAWANHVAMWNGSVWTGVDTGADSWVGALGEHQGKLVAGGTFLHAGRVDAEGVAMWDGVAWIGGHGVTNDPIPSVLAMTPWGGQMVIGGSYFTSPPEGSPAGDVSLLSAWDGQVLRSIGHPNGTVRAMTTRRRIDRSTDLIIAGDFTSIDGISANRVAVLNDTNAGSWQPLGGQLNGQVNAVAVYNGKVYAGGQFVTADATVVNNIAMWDGASWVPLFSGVNGPVYALQVFNGQLFIGGAFTNGSGVFSAGVIGWNGSNFTAVHTNAYAGAVYALAVYDNALVIGGQFTGLGLPNLGWYDGLFQGVFAGGADGPVRALAVSNGALVVGGEFAGIGGALSSGIAMWRGSLRFPSGGGWTSFGNAVDGPVRALASLGGEIHVGGEFTHVRNGSLYSPVWARYSESGTPWITSNPVPSVVECGGVLRLSVTIASGFGGVQYHWRRNGGEISSGPNADGSFVEIHGGDLEIRGMTAAEAGSYDCVVTNGCGSVASVAAVVTVDGVCPCRADFNGDGVASSQDFFDFLTAFFEGSGSSDFNHSGDLTSQDFFDFLVAFFAGC